MLLAVLSACMLCAVAQSLMPGGPVRQVGKLVCGLVLLCVVLAPVVELDLDRSTRWLSDYFAYLEPEQQELQNTVGREWRKVIETECAAYIVDKAKEMGISCSAEVVCYEAEAGVWIPESAWISGVMGEGEKQRLVQRLEEELNLAVYIAREADE